MIHPNTTLHEAMDVYHDDVYVNNVNPTTGSHIGQLSCINGIKNHTSSHTLMVDFTSSSLSNLIKARRSDTVLRRDKNDKLVLSHVKNATINRTVIEFLSRVFKHAEVKYGMHYPHRPVFQRLREAAPRNRYLREHEYHLLTESIRSDFEAVFDFALLSGLRKENLLLRWDQVDLEAGVVNVTTKGNHGTGSTMEFDLPEAARQIIDAQRNADGTRLHPEMVFTYEATRSNPNLGIEKGKRYPITRSGLDSWWQRHRNKTSIRDFRWHDTRHSAATELHDASGDLLLVQRQLGHKKIQTTTRYAHAKRTKLREALNTMSRSTPWGKKYEKH